MIAWFTSDAVASNALWAVCCMSLKIKFKVRARLLWKLMVETLSSSLAAGTHATEVCYNNVFFIAFPIDNKRGRTKSSYTFSILWDHGPRNIFQAPFNSPTFPFDFAWSCSPFSWKFYNVLGLWPKLHSDIAPSFFIIFMDLRYKNPYKVQWTYESR